MVNTSLQKAVFLDRDGVLVRSIVKNGKPFAPRVLKDFKIYKSSKKLINKFVLSKFKVFVITNQPDVGRGLIKKETLKKMHKSLKKNIKINKIFTCIHKPEKKCKCRKPSPEMIFKAAKLYKIDLKKSFLIGDRLSDIVSGKKAGCRTVFINRNYKEKKPNNQDTSVANLEEATKYIINNNE